MAPINLPDASEVSEVILPDGASAGEVIAPDGSTVFSAIPDSAIFYFDYEGGSGDAVDRWGDITGVLNGGATFTTDSARGTYAVKTASGRSNYIKVAKSSQDYQTITLSSYFKALSDDRHFLYGTDGNDAGNESDLRVDTTIDTLSGNFRDDGGGNNTHSATASGGISTNRWYMATFAFDNANSEVRFYLNDTKIGTSTISMGAWDTGDWYFGIDSDDFGENDADVIHDETKLYSEALTDTQVSDLYNTGSI